ncbi:hypothetical protein AGLY_014098 [Aphis glycines]|uniref:Reverse transcriptase domain-containing protein n=1 Tax=Aphis glycines TaxID=307491 RepID=A0A6G0T434_APHGL|nr:hypothetical protein AGLY_014098 [Aphis glycines]
MLTLDVKNAFNSAAWDTIVWALERQKVPNYLRNILSQYLLNRRITFTMEDGSIRGADMSCVVPQGSVLGPDLWNLLYDDLLKKRLPEGTELIGFADDVAIVTTAQVPFLLKERLGAALEDVVAWMNTNGLELALHKTEAIIFTNRNKRNTMAVKYPPYSFASKNCIKYLGVYFDQRMHFKQHAAMASKRAAEATRQLGQILPNLRGVKQKTRRVLATVVTSRLLYGAPIWKGSITAKALGDMESV